MENVTRSEQAGEQPELTTADLAVVRTPVAEPSESRERPTLREGSSSAREGSSSADDEATPLFVDKEAAELRGRWDSVQAGFVDEPRRAVEAADGLVASTMTRLAEIFATERQQLEAQWDRGDDVTTEDLRLALRRYRSFFTRLLSI